MNAAEARKITNQNGPKLFESNFKRTVTFIDTAIRAATGMGYFSVKQAVSLPSIVQNEVLEKVIIHYQELGYKVEVYDFCLMKQVQLSWAEEDL